MARHFYFYFVGQSTSDDSSWITYTIIEWRRTKVVWPLLNESSYPPCYLVSLLCQIVISQHWYKMQRFMPLCLLTHNLDETLGFSTASAGLTFRTNCHLIFVIHKSTAPCWLSMFLTPRTLQSISHQHRFLLGPLATILDLLPVMAIMKTSTLTAHCCHLICGIQNRIFSLTSKEPSRLPYHQLWHTKRSYNWAFQ